jgi:proteasome activator subunit 4
MTEKDDDTIIRSSSPSQLRAVVDPPKPTIVEDPVSRAILDPTPIQPQAGSTTPDSTPPVKEGFNYWNHLPYPVEDEATRIAHLNDIIGDLYTCIRAGDFEAGAKTASRQIKRWLHLKFKMPKETRKKLIKLYYELSLTPGIDSSAADTFATMFKLLASYAPSLKLLTKTSQSSST